MNVENLFKVDGPILLFGESGCGKTHLAQLIHRNSMRGHEKFLTLNLSTICEELMESEFYGHLKGSFTGAASDRIGYFEAVGQGTLFLDEIGELSLKGQKRLLRVVEEGKFIPVGSFQERPFRGRIVAATHRPLWQMVEKGEFRQDLYYRLLVFSYEIPPLRSRPQDIRDFIEIFLNEFCLKKNRPQLRISPEAQKFFLTYSWPGNIRELKNCMDFVTSLAIHEVGHTDLPNWMTPVQNTEFRNQVNGQNKVNCSVGAGIRAEDMPLDFKLAVNYFEKFYLSYILNQFGGKINLTSQLLGMSKSTLIAKARKYGINTLKIRASVNALPADFPLKESYGPKQL